MKRADRFTVGTCRLPLAVGLVAAILTGCNRAPEPAQAPAGPDVTRLAAVATDEISMNPELNEIAMTGGRALYETHCASCHGPDLKGVAGMHVPDLTDNDWIYAGDDLDTGGIVHKASDVEKTLLNGIRARPQITNLPSQQENDAANIGNKNLAVMPPFGPTLEYALTEDEITDVAEYVMMLSGQQHDMAVATRGKAIFADKGSCYDCHGEAGDGDQAIGSTNLTKPNLYLWGSSKDAVLETLHQGRINIMPAFAEMLKPEEAKALAVYVFSQGGPGTFPQ